jgi:hypothetical protein
MGEDWWTPVRTATPGWVRLPHGHPVVLQNDDQDDDDDE